MPDQSNPYKPDEKVLTKVNGAQVEVTVRLVWNQEVQVRTPDGALRWRTVRTVAPLPASIPTTDLPALPDEPAPAIGGSEETSGGESPVNQDAAVSDEPQHAEAAFEEAPPAAISTVKPEQPPAMTKLPMDAGVSYTPCGAPEIEAARKRSKKRGHRR